MKRLLIAVPLILVALACGYGTSVYWEVMTKPAALLAGAVIGGCLAAALVVLAWRPERPPARHQASLPSPWERGR